MILSSARLTERDHLRASSITLRRVKAKRYGSLTWYLHTLPGWEDPQTTGTHPVVSQSIITNLYLSMVLMVQEPPADPLLPSPNSLLDALPIPQSNRLPNSTLNIPFRKSLPYSLDAPRDTLLVLGRRPLQVGLGLGLVDGLPRLEDLDEKGRVGGRPAGAARVSSSLVARQVDPVSFGEDVLRAQERVRQRLVCGVDVA